MIGVFDSGVGGLSVLKHFLEDHPQYNYIYLGDSANVPYGNKSPEIIYNYTIKAIDFLESQGCKLIIVACNSASAQALRKIQQEYLPNKFPDLKVLGVIRPMVEKIVSLEKIKKVGIIGTRATINSNIYLEEISALKPDIDVIQKSAPLLVPLIEENWSKKPEAKMILKKYLRPLKVKQVEALVLACTHYPFLIKDIKRIMGKKCLILNPGEIISGSLKKYLEKHPELKLKPKEKDCQFYTSDDVARFVDLAGLFLKKKIINVKKIIL